MWSFRAKHASTISPNFNVTLPAEGAIGLPHTRRTQGSSGKASAASFSRELEWPKASYLQADLTGAIYEGILGRLHSPLKTTTDGKVDLQRFENYRIHPQSAMSDAQQLKRER
jgi:hypothetical protein